MISDTDLIAYIRPSTDDEIDTLRRLERAAVAYVQNRTGRYFGAVGVITETLQWRGWPMQLSNVPDLAEAFTFESWDGSAFTAVDSTTFHTDGAFVYLERGNTSWAPLSMPTRYRVTYTAGYTEQGADEWDAPEDVKQAVILLVGHWFENREAAGVGAYSTRELPLAVSSLIDGHVRVAV